MSAPNTNTEKQTRRHRPSLAGIAVAVGFAALALIVFLTFVTDPDDTLVEDDAVATGEEGTVTEMAPAEPETDAAQTGTVTTETEAEADPVATIADESEAAGTEDGDDAATTEDTGN